ncbi:MAG: transporter substrate-binding domain-containing protein [Gammaproteobacteria bacterium]
MATLVAAFCAVLVTAQAAALASRPRLGLEQALRAEATSPRPLRVLVLGGTVNSTHRRDAIEFAILSDYARTHDLAIDWRPVYRPAELYERLVRGEADLAIGAMPAEYLKRPTISATHPLATQRFQVIGRNGLRVRDPLGLAGLRLGIRLSSPLWSYFEQLQRAVPGLQLDALPSTLDRDAALRLVADGVYDATVLPVTLGSGDLEAYPRLQRQFDLTDDEAFGWYLRSDRQGLLRSLNGFIARYHAAYFEPVRAPRNFTQIRRRGVLRIGTRVDPRNYFVARGKPSGYEFELATAFANAHGLKLQILTATRDEQLVGWVKEGAVDVVTTRIDGSLVRGEPGVSFSRIYHHTSYVLLTSTDAPLYNVADLKGRRVGAYADSAELRATRSAVANTGLIPIAVDRALPAGALLDRVVARAIDAVVVDAETAREVIAANPGLVSGLSLPSRVNYRWLVRTGDPRLKRAIDRFITAPGTRRLDAVLTGRYLVPRHATQLAGKGSRISPFDALLRTYAERYDFDWRLIAAQAYQESRFDPRAESTGGAKGLMQMLPGTARALGFRNILEPESAIHAGVKYLYKLRNEFDAEVPAGERTWFALAAYNAGYARVARARRLAARLNLDPNRWFGNVETAMMKFARPDNGGKPQRGYGQAIIYVRQIQSLYSTYLQLGDAGNAPALTGPTLSEAIDERYSPRHWALASR